MSRDRFPLCVSVRTLPLSNRNDTRMVNTLLFEDSDAEATFHLFVSAAYFTPVIAKNLAPSSSVGSGMYVGPRVADEFAGMLRDPPEP